MLQCPLDIFCRAGSVQQAQQSTHLDEGLNPLYLNNVHQQLVI